nr:monothiol glutaredoxin-S2-like [Tanacetum cinerariifolium]
MQVKAYKMKEYLDGVASRIISVRTLICSFGANPTVYELDEHPEGQKIEKELTALGCKPSVPAVFTGQELVGGANEIMSQCNSRKQSIFVKLWCT